MDPWPELVRDHGPVVWSTAWRLLRCDADAADCFQATFLAALDVSRREAVRSWPALLRRLATARALEMLRRRVRERGRVDAIDPDAVASPGPPDGSGELAEALRAALARIDPRQAQAFWLVTFEGMAYAEAAAQLGLTENHLGVLVHRARARLRRLLHAFDPAPAPVGPKEAP
jgi:RNA polymerase sigma-70 factor (ECF subfamily)